MNTPFATSTTQVLGITASLLSSGVFLASSALVISPLLPLPINESTRIFSSIYHMGKTLQVPFNVVAIVANAVAAYFVRSQRLEHCAASSLVIGSLMFTITYMMPGIERILRIHGMDGSQIQSVRKQEVIDLLLAWKSQNYVRAGLTLAAGLLGSFAHFKHVSSWTRRAKIQ